MLTAAAVAAVADATAQVLVESFVIAVLLLLLGAAVVFVFHVIVAVPSTLFKFVAASFASSQDDKPVPNNCGNKKKGENAIVEFEIVEEKTEVIELLDDDEDEDEEFASEEGDDEVIFLGTVCTKKTTPASEGPRRTKKAVSFGNVQAQEYSVTIGDHPLGGEEGFPISLDWAHTEPKDYSLDWYDETKPKGKCAFLSREQRMLRVVNVAGIRPEDVQKLERTRLWKVEAEVLASRSVLRVPAANQ